MPNYAIARILALIVALPLAAVTGYASPQGTDPPTCIVGLELGPGDSCTYAGGRFWVEAKGHACHKGSDPDLVCRTIATPRISDCVLTGVSGRFCANLVGPEHPHRWRIVRI